MRPRQKDPSKVLVVDRDAMSSALLADALSRQLGCDAIEIPSSEVLPTIEAGNVEAVVVSAHLNSTLGAGLDLARSVSFAYPRTPIVILLDDSTRELVINAFRTGARGVFHREKPLAELIDCIENAQKGRIWADNEGTKYLLEELRKFPVPCDSTTDNLLALTTREMQVVRSAAKGKGNRAIAAELGLSEHTVKNYLFHAFEKLGVSSRVELLVFLTVRGHSIGPSSGEEMEKAAAD